jgi:hypothetical protein
MANTISRSVLELSIDDTLVDKGLDSARARVKSFGQAVEQWSGQLQGDFKSASDSAKTLGGALTDVFGERLEQRARASATGILMIGDATKLTSAEVKQHLTALDAWIEKAAKLGTAVSPGMLAARQALATVNAESQKTPPLLEQIRSGAASTFGDMSSQIKATALGFVSAQAVIGGVQGSVRALADFVSSSVESYANAEAATKKMTVALQQQGTATPEVIEQFNALATQFQATTVYSDDLITEMESLLTQVGSVAPQQMHAALEASTTLASGLGIDLRDATMLVAKAFAGGGDELGRLKSILGDAYRPGMDMAAVLDAINSKFGGQAIAAAETYRGKIQQLANAWDNVKEAVGEQIADDPVLLAGLRQAKDAADGAAEGGNAVTLAFDAFAVSSPEWLKALGHLHEDLSSVADAANTLADGVARMAAVKPPAAFGGADIKSQFADWDQQHKALADDIAKGWEKDGAAAARYAEVVQASFRKWSGAETAEQVKVLDTVFRRLADSGQITERQLRQIAAEAAKLAQDGGTLTPRLWDIVFGLGVLDPKLANTADGFEHLGTKVELAIPPLDAFAQASDALTNKTKWGDVPDVGFKVGSGFEEAAKQTKKEKDEVGELARALSQLAQIADGTLGNLARDLGTVVAALDTTTKGVHAVKDGFAAGGWHGLLETTSGLMGIASAAIAAGKAIKNMFFGTAGRDAVKDFAKTFQEFDLDTMQFKPGGGFDQLHAKLLALPDPKYGEKLWSALTQGVGRNNPEQAKALIDLITKALSEQQTKVEDTTTAVEDAAAKQQTAREAALQVFKDQIAGIDQEMKSLQDSIAGEAPEEEMGVVERQTRARLEALADQRKQLQEELEKQQNDTTDAAAETADGVSDINDRAEDVLGTFRDWADALKDARDAASGWGMPGMPPAVPMAAGGFGRVRRPTFFYSAGDEDYAFSGEGKSFGARANASGPIEITIVTQLDGRELARNQVRHTPNELARVGVRSR